MSDIDYGAIQRSVQDATSSLRSDVQRLVNDMSRMSQQANNDDQIESTIREIDQRLQHVEQMVQSSDLQAESTARQLVNYLAELKTRFATIEKFAMQFSDYLQAKYNEEKEDREYRGVS